MSKVTQSFNAEIQQLLNLVIHSLYSKKEIFLRELISNASDAIDKRKFAALTQSDLALSGDYQINITPVKTEKILKISDNGIGMNQAEVTEFIGTIARSGTKKFAELHKQAQQNPELIGQFGVGFYSSFMVAKKVTLHTQKAGENQGTLWESEGQGEYTISSVPRAEGAGTTITLHLKEFDTEEKVTDFTDEWTLKNLIKTYSNFISYPIHLVKEDQTTEVVNSQKALWQKSPTEVTAEEHTEFYKHLSHDWNTPAKWWHWRAEGNIEFTGLLYIPSKKPYNFNMKDYDYGLSLYIKRVFIMDNNKDLLPPYLRFIKGLVDCSDLPLNVSREILQHDRQIQIIKKNVLNKVLTGFKDMLEKSRTDYETFFKEFGPTLKEGIALDPTYKDKLADLLLFTSSTQDPSTYTTLAEYLARKKEGQKAIYYITGESLERVINSPYLEALKDKGLEVLFLTDAVDEWVVRELTEYQGLKLQSITQDNLDIETEEEKNSREEEWTSFQERYRPSFENIQKTFTEVKEIRLSKRLTTTPACLVSGEGEMSMQMQKILKQMGESTFPNQQKRILELNPKHPLVEHLLTLDDNQKVNWTEILYYQALIAEGSPLQNPIRFTELMTENLLNRS